MLRQRTVEWIISSVYMCVCERDGEKEREKKQLSWFVQHARVYKRIKWDEEMNCIKEEMEKSHEIKISCLPWEIHIDNSSEWWCQFRSFLCIYNRIAVDEGGGWGWCLLRPTLVLAISVWLPRATLEWKGNAQDRVSLSFFLDKNSSFYIIATLLVHCFSPFCSPFLYAIHCLTHRSPLVIPFHFTVPHFTPLFSCQEVFLFIL